MTRFELAKKFSEKMENKYSAHECDTIIKELFEVIIKETENDDITLGGIGVFKQKIKNARLCRNPSTGEKVNIPAKKVFQFKTSGTLNRQLNS